MRCSTDYLFHFVIIYKITVSSYVAQVHATANYLFWGIPHGLWGNVPSAAAVATTIKKYITILGLLDYIYVQSTPHKPEGKAVSHLLSD